MAIADTVTTERVRCIGGIASRKRALEQLADLLATATPSLTASEILTGLLQRERLGSTAIGHGIALPRTRSERVERPVGALLRLNVGVDFDATDTEPVDLLFGWLLPTTATAAHRERLNRLTQQLVDTSLAARLRAAADDTALFQTLGENRANAPLL